MPRLIWLVWAFAAIAVSTGAAGAQPAMKATAPMKMMPPAEKARMQECQKMAAEQNVKMDARAKFLMDCMNEKKAK